MAADPEVELAGERVRLLPERALFWARASTLLVADAHWGKAAAFRAAGVAVPGGTTSAGLARLTRALARTGAERLVFLGDLFHAREGKAPRTLAALRDWRRSHARVAMTLVRGNHDRRAGDPPAELDIACCDPPCAAPPFVFLHHPAEPPRGYALAGHLHPSVTLRGRGRQVERFPCFHFGPRVGVLPAFGDFTGSADVAPAPGDRVFVVAGDEVVEVLAPPRAVP
ncbi:MAG TPA: ligase-associated DNA damage response endonuclease PdeM [Longimicrobiaceae bacterium]|nr:ligase-associated DNA damage response endonuclease PdeM [Longimicrobiaceae bacterium]